MIAGIDSGRAMIWRSSARLSERARAGVEQRVQREPEHEVDEERERAARATGRRATCRRSASGPRTASPIAPEPNRTSASAGTRTSDDLGRPASPIPSDLAQDELARRSRAEISSSMTRLAFSATTPEATHIP